MYDLKQSLLACGYSGPCEDLTILKWALRAGASSQFFIDLIYWLELQLSLVFLTQQARENITVLFRMLRQSVLMKSSYGSDGGINPKEFRLQTLKVLIRQVHLRKLPEHLQHMAGKSLQSARLNTKNFRQLTITLNVCRNAGTGDWNQRLVDYH